MSETCELTIVMPCLNEAETLGRCIEQGPRFFSDRSGVRGEVIVADNGSTDGSQAIARGAGARVVDMPARGYGSALRGGIRGGARHVTSSWATATTATISAGSTLFVGKLREGHDLVMGNRFAGGIRRGRDAATAPLFRQSRADAARADVSFAARCGDFHCGLRGFAATRCWALDLRGAGNGIRQSRWS